MTQCERCKKRNDCKEYQESLHDDSRFLFGCSEAEEEKMKLSAERLAKLDEKISVFSCMKKFDDEVVIKMSKDLFCELIAINHPFVVFSSDDLHPHKYKDCILELVENPNYVAVAYYNIITGKEHHIREIEEDES